MSAEDTLENCLDCVLDGNTFQVSECQLDYCPIADAACYTSENLCQLGNENNFDEGWWANMDFSCLDLSCPELGDDSSTKLNLLYGALAALIIS